MLKKLPTALLALSLSLTPLTALAQAPPGTPPNQAENDEGRARFLRGVQLFREGDFRSALVEFRRAYDISKNFKVLYNIGQTEYELADYAGALRSFERYLQGGGAEIEPARRAQVEEDLKKLSARVARVEIKSNAQGAEVLVDDVVVGVTPLPEAVLVSIGRRKISLQKGGAVSPARFVDLAGGDKTSVTIELAESKPIAPVATPAPLPPPPAEPPSRTGLWVSLAVTGGLAIGTAVLGGLAVAAHSDAEAKLGTLGVKAQDVADAHSKTKTLSLVADIMGGATIAMIGATIVIGVTSGKGEPPKAATITVNPRGLALGGAF